MKAVTCTEARLAVADVPGAHVVALPLMRRAGAPQATACGTDIVVDPARDSPYTAADRGHITTMPEVVELAISTVEKLRRLPVAWQHVWRGIDALGIKPKHPVVFECVGVSGVLDAIIGATPRRSIRRSTCGSCSATRRWSSVTRSTPWPTVSSTRSRWSPGRSG